MAKKLKCWKKKGNLQWENKKSKKSLMVYWYATHPDVVIQEFDYTKPMSKGGMKYIGPSFRNKESAEKFAKAYMKKHDTCKI